MKKILFLLLLIWLNFSCASKFKTIDKIVAKTEKQINKKTLDGKKTVESYYYSIDSIDYTTLNVYKNKSALIKINFEIIENEYYEVYNRKCQIYLDNNIPIYITEIINAKQTSYFTGRKMANGKFASQMDHFFLVNNKVYIENWKKFDIKSIDEDISEYIMSNKEQYRKIINYVLAIVSKK